MSCRSLFEVNHDFAGKINNQPIAFAEALHRYLSSGNQKDAEHLERFGVRLFARRHHSDGYVIEWGGTRICSQDSVTR